MKESNMKVMLIPNGLCIDGDDIWFMQLNSNKLVRVSMQNYDIKQVICMEDEKIFDKRSNLDRIIKIENLLVIFLHGRDYIYIYEINTNVIRKVSEKFADYPIHSNAIIKYKKDIYMLPYNGVPLIKYNPLTNILETYGGDDTRNQFMSRGYDYYPDMGIVYATDINKNILYTVDLPTCTIKDQKVGDNHNIYFGVNKIGDNYILPNLNKQCITIWNELTNVVRENDVFPNGFIANTKKSYWNIYRNQKSVFLFPFQSNQVLSVDVDINEINVSFEKYKIDNCSLDGRHISVEAFLDVIEVDYGEKVLAYDVKKANWVLFDLVNKKVEFMPQGNQDILNELVKKEISQGNALNEYYSKESYYDSLSQLIDLLILR
jgi:hypothetical protein